MTDRSKAIATHTNSSSKRLDRSTELLRTLAPVRAIGMNDEMASDWAAVVMADCRSLSDAAFLAGCAEARQTADHHAKILPAIFRGAKAASQKTHTQHFLSTWDGAIEQAKAGYPAIGSDGRSGPIGRIAAQIIEDTDHD